MIDTAANVVFDFAAAGNEEIMQNVKVILSTPAGTVPFDREFGVSIDLIDLPMDRAKGQLTVEYIKKVRKYEPRAKVKKVTFEYDGVVGILRPKVVIGLG